MAQFYEDNNNSCTIEYYRGPLFPSTNINKTIEMITGFFTKNLATPIPFEAAFNFAQSESDTIMAGVEEVLAQFSD